MSPPPEAAGPSGDDRAARLRRLRADLEAGSGCVPLDGATQYVFGEGNPHARLMLVGEAPGEQEDRAGRPFVGRAGRLLDEMLDAAGIRREDVWITNVVKRRPIRIADGRKANRAPTRAEVRACLPVLEAEIAIVQPSVIVCLGAVAASALIHPDFRLSAEHGQWFSGPRGTCTLATFHPAYILRLQGAERDEIFRLSVEDLRRASEAARET